MGPLLTWILVASAPALFWLWLFYRRDRWEPEPKAKVLKLFALGMAAAAPAYGATKHAPDWVARGVLARMVPTLLLLLWHATNLASKASPFRKPD